MVRFFVLYVLLAHSKITKAAFNNPIRTRERYYCRHRHDNSPKQKVLKLNKCVNKRDNEVNEFPSSVSFPSTSRLISQNSLRINSEMAAALINDVYTTSTVNDFSSEDLISTDGNQYTDSPTLIVITSDASRGSKRLLGLSTVIRAIYDVPKSNSTRNKYPQRDLDKVTFSTRRRQSSTHNINIVEAEIAAIALGLKMVLERYPLEEQRRRVLIISDCEGALQFYCGQNIRRESGSRLSSNLKDKPIPSAIQNHPHYQLWEMVQQPHLSNTSSKEDSIWDMPWAKMTKVKSAHLGISGFFDHEVADVLSSFAKGIPNKEAERLGLLGSGITKNSSQNVGKMDKGRSLQRSLQPAAPRLSLYDLKYLASSEGFGVANSNSAQDNNPKKQIQIKKENGERLERCKKRMKVDLGIDLHRQKK